MKRHLSLSDGSRETVTLHEVGLVIDERLQHVREVRGRHLPVGGQDHGEVGTPRQRTLATRCDGGAYTEIRSVRYEVDAARASTRCQRGAVRAPIIDDDHFVDEGRYPLECGADELHLVVGRHHCGDRLTFEHAQAVAIVSRSDGQGLAREARPA
jgi:hypothetical protein